MKVLGTKEYTDLKTKSDAYDGIVASILEANKDLKADEVTLEVIRAVMENSADNAEVADLNEKLLTVTSERDNLQKQVTDLTEKNSKLSELPGAESITTGEKPKSDAGAKATEDEALDFATKNQGNTSAIVAKLKELGYEPTKF